MNNEMAAFTIHALEQSSLRSPRSLPVTHDWLSTGRDSSTPACGRRPELSHRPSYSGPRATRGHFPRSCRETDREGLADRDMVSAAYAGRGQSGALSKELRSKQFGELVPDYRAWEELLRAWLVPKPDQIDPLSPDEINLVAADPPPPFFVLFEAAQSREGRIGMRRRRSSTSALSGRSSPPRPSLAPSSAIRSFVRTNRHSSSASPLAARSCSAIRACSRQFRKSNMRDLLKFLSDGGVLSDTARRPEAVRTAFREQPKKEKAMRPRFQSATSIKWGKLVKSWATGSNYMGTGPASDQPSGPPIPLPGRSPSGPSCVRTSG